ncbi:MAG: hypothetical protein RL038_1300 [Actinomycetota bacterium]
MKISTNPRNSVPFAAMANPRQPSIRATRLRGESGKGAPDPEQNPDEIKDPRIPREVVDHALARREAILEIKRTGGFYFDGADTDPYLIRTAQHYGIPLERNCPVCEKVELQELIYVYSRELGHASGRSRRPNEIDELALNHGFLKVFHVEVCIGCGWNHVLVSYVLGDGRPRKPKRKPRDLVG